MGICLKLYEIILLNALIKFKIKFTLGIYLYITSIINKFLDLL